MLRLFTFLFAIFIGSAAAATQAWVNAPKDGFLNLRTGPGTAYHVIDKMPHRSKVHVLHAPGKWVKLQNAHGTIGWAHSGWLSKHKPHPIKHLPPKPDAVEYTMWVHAPAYGALNLRRGAGKHHPVIMKMMQGSKVKVLGKKGKWFFVRHVSGHVGWAHSAYLSKRKMPTVRQHPGYSQLHEPHQPSNRDLRDAIRTCKQLPEALFHACMARERALLMAERSARQHW
ncbi:SH3 domain-containing protein [Thalassococcus lentus]|uniref:SH3 domain-containing protein n=1 Tax=Thalassococcus lentus TaxID=1210524 RepID=A0ABT4XUV8_9RHOB|nr:SH3 domain-containing protein [Thalassococcus lentus]MDA7425749.1 SH3 domain-containing protein [Thalassococcus lentus]